MTLSIKAEPRVKKGQGNKGLEGLRKAGIFPAVYYGKKEEAKPIQMSASEFGKVWKEAGESTVVSIIMPTGNVDALIHDVQFDVVTGQPIHADFYVFEKGHKVEIAIPLEFVGVSPAVKEQGAVLMKVLHEIKIKAEPAKLPHAIEVDISPLINFNDHITAKEITLPAGVELMENPDEVVASVAEAKEEVVEAAPIDLSAIEVEKKGKKEEEGTETAPESATPESK